VDVQSGLDRTERRRGKENNNRINAKKVMKGGRPYQLGKIDCLSLRKGGKGERKWTGARFGGKRRPLTNYPQERRRKKEGVASVRSAEGKVVNNQNGYLRIKISISGGELQSGGRGRGCRLFA